MSLLVFGAAAAERRPAVYGHRGASAEAPDNSLLAFRIARRRGATGVELDVRRARTGEIVLAHDPRVLIGGRTMKVRKASLAELRLPTLDEALRELGPRMKVNIEIKAETPFTRGLEREVVRIVRRHRLGDRAIVSSFNPIALRRVKRFAPELRVGLLVHKGRFDRLARFARAENVHPADSLIDERSMARWKRRGFEVHAWTIDSPDRMLELRELGVDAIITNDPAKALATLGD